MAPVPGRTDTDWTRDEGGRSNSSAQYLECVADVASVIRSIRVGHDPEGSARLIVSRLAHVYGLAPTGVCREVGPGIHPRGCCLALGHDGACAFDGGPIG